MAAPRGDASARAISTVLDASLCLLLVGASAATLAATPTVGEHATPGPTTTVGPDTADETADLLTTSTARVSYEAGSASEASATGPARNRTVHDTLAGLLASAARADAVRTGSHGPRRSGAPTLRRGRAGGRSPASLSVERDPRRSGRGGNRTAARPRRSRRRVRGPRRRVHRQDVVAVSGTSSRTEWSR